MDDDVEGEVEVEEEESSDIGALKEPVDQVHQDPQVDDPKLAEQLGSLSVEDDLAVKQSSAMTESNLALLDPSQDQAAVARKVKTKKKAAGWAI